MDAEDLVKLLIGAGWVVFWLLSRYRKMLAADRPRAPRRRARPLRSLATRETPDETPSAPSIRSRPQDVVPVKGRMPNPTRAAADAPGTVRARARAALRETLQRPRPSREERVAQRADTRARLLVAAVERRAERLAELRRAFILHTVMAPPAALRRRAGLPGRHGGLLGRPRS